jgi:hypothetical protein
MVDAFTKFVIGPCMLKGWFQVFELPLSVFVKSSLPTSRFYGPPHLTFIDGFVPTRAVFWK